MDVANDTGESRYVSTGELPSREQLQQLVGEAHERYRTNTDGATSQVYPALERVRGDQFGICIAGVSGNVYTAGDSEAELTIMSVAKPFVYAIVCQQLGGDELRRLVGVNATGLPFNSLAAVERSRDGRTNPMVNAGAIAVTSLVSGEDAEQKWQFISEGSRASRAASSRSTTRSTARPAAATTATGVWRCSSRATAGSTPILWRQSTCTRARAV